MMRLERRIEKRKLEKEISSYGTVLELSKLALISMDTEKYVKDLFWEHFKLLMKKVRGKRWRSCRILLQVKMLPKSDERDKLIGIMPEEDLLEVII